MEIISKIIILNKRSQYAYKEYFENRKYYQAKRIYNTNIKILELLEEFQFNCSTNLLEIVFQYIFHLEDWFLQFNEAETKVIKLDEDFIFSRLEYSFMFPQEFFNKIENK